MKSFTLKDYVISGLIIVVSFAYFMTKFIPEELETVSFLGYEIGSFGFIFFRDFVYYAKMKILILFFSITWYLTCKHWWKQAILVVIIMEMFKLATTLNSSSQRMDEIEYITSLPVTIPIIILLIFISEKMNRVRLLSNVLNILDNEIDDVFFESNQEKQSDLGVLKKQIDKTKKAYQKKDKKKYLNKLISIRNSFYKV